jgi:hypothetical protein
MRNTLQNFRLRLAGFLLAWFASVSFSFAQMPNDAIYMSKNTACLAVSYTHSSWDQYWESSLKRQNLNIGTHTTQNVMPMLAVGITKNLNFIAAIPYIWTQTSAGNLRWQKGFQDASGWLKFRFLNKSGLSLHAIVGASVPVGDYMQYCDRQADGKLPAQNRHLPDGFGQLHFQKQNYH